MAFLLNTRLRRGLVREFLATVAGSGDTVLDSSPSQVNARLGGAAGADAKDPTWATEGLDFDGTDDYLDAGVATATPFEASANPWTFVCVCKRDVAGAAHQLFQARKVAANNQGADAFITTGNFVQLRLTATDGTQETLTDDQTVGASAWHFIAVTKSASMLRVQVGKHGPSTSVPTKTWTTISAGNLDIGAFGTWANTNRFNGKFAYVAVYNRFLTWTQLAHVERNVRRVLRARGVVLS